MWLAKWGASSARSPASDLVHRAFTAAYNLDLDDAKVLARQAIAADPDASETHRTLASVLWLEILYRRGALSVDNYLGNVSKPLPSTVKPPPELEAEFRVELQKTIDLAEAHLKRAPNGVMKTSPRAGTNK